MVVKIVAEELDVRDGSGSDVGIGEVAREENKGHVANVFRVPQTGDVPDLQRGLPVCEQDLGRVLDLRQPARIHEFLKRCVSAWESHEISKQMYLEENFSKDTVGLFSKDCGEDDGDPVVRGLNIDGFLITIMDGH